MSPAAAEAPKYEWEIEAAIECAEKDGFTVIRSTETTLLLDLDDGQSIDRYRKISKSIGALFGLKESSRWLSKSKVGTHVVVNCKPMGFLERVALQAVLGSDPIREALAVGMYLDGHKDPSVLFQPKGATIL